MVRRTLFSLLVAFSLVAPLGPTPGRASGAGGGESQASAAEGSWRVFTSRDGRFRVELPGEPQLDRSQRSTLLGAVEETKYTLRFGEALVAVEVHDIPRLAARMLPASSILDRVRAGVVSDMQAELVDSRDTTLQGHEARDFSYRISGESPLVERALVALVGNRIYLVTGMAPDSPGAHPEIARFFASFRFWASGDRPPEIHIEQRAERGSSEPDS